MIRKVILSAGAAMAVCAAVPAGAAWVEAGSKHFVVLGDMSQAEAQGWAAELERLDKVLRVATSTPEGETPASARVTVYVVPSIGAVQKLAGKSNVGGFYNGNAQSFVSVTPRSTGGNWQFTPQRVLFHEYTHHVLLSSADTAYPDWVQEGLAEFFGTAKFEPNGDMILGELPVDRGFALAQTNQMSASELFKASEHRGTDIDVSQLYSRAWGMIHMLMLKPERAGQLSKYLKLVAGGTDPVVAGTQAFGDLVKLDSELNVYVRQKWFKSLRIEAAKMPVGNIGVRDLRACEAQMVDVRMRSAVGVNDKTAPGVLADARKAAAGCENDPFVLRTITEAAYDAKDNAGAMAAADKLLAVDPANVMAMIYKGRVYARAKDWTNARTWFAKANRQDPNYALPLVLYYDSFTNAGQKPPRAAVDGLYRAIMLAPQDDMLRARVGRALVADGDLKLARRVMAPLASVERKSDNNASMILQMIDEGKDAATVLAAIDKLHWDQFGDNYEPPKKKG
jgi:tetratricopeptide (TPR) repeat protein